MIVQRGIAFVRLVGPGLCAIVRQLVIPAVKMVELAIVESVIVPLDGLDQLIVVARRP